jgi:hypothetical protein
MAAMKKVLSPISLARMTPQDLRKPSTKPWPSAIPPVPANSGRVRVSSGHTSKEKEAWRR